MSTILCGTDLFAVLLWRCLFFSRSSSSLFSLHCTFLAVFFPRCFSIYSLQVNIFNPALSTLGSLSFSLTLLYSGYSFHSLIITLPQLRCSSRCSLHYSFVMLLFSRSFQLFFTLDTLLQFRMFFFTIISSRYSLSASLLTLLFHAAPFTCSFRGALLTLLFSHYPVPLRRSIHAVLFEALLSRCSHHVALFSLLSSRSSAWTGGHKAEMKLKPLWRYQWRIIEEV